METVDLDGIPCRVVRRGGRRVRVAFRQGRFSVILPRHLDPLPVIERCREWILEKHEWFRSQRLLAEELPLRRRGNEEFVALVRDLSGRYSAMLGVKPLGVGFRRMKSKWGSCSSRGKVNLNTWLQVLPDDLVAYVLFHELAHLRVRDHGPGFKTLIEAGFPGRRDLDRRLKLYSLRLL